MQRQNKEFTTTNGHKIVIKSYMTFDEMEPILKISDDFEKSKKIIEIALISIDGDSADAYAKVRQLPLKDYTDIAKEVSATVDGDFPQAK